MIKLSRMKAFMIYWVHSKCRENFAVLLRAETALQISFTVHQKSTKILP